MVILADYPLEDIFVHGGDHGHDESHVLMDDLGLKRVRVCVLLFKVKPVFHVGCAVSVVNNRVDEIVASTDPLRSP